MIVLNRLSPEEKDAQVAMLRSKGMTLDQIAELFGVTRERIRQREYRHYRRSERLMGQVGLNLQMVELQCIAWRNYLAIDSAHASS